MFSLIINSVGCFEKKERIVHSVKRKFPNMSDKEALGINKCFYAVGIALSIISIIGTLILSFCALNTLLKINNFFYIVDPKILEKWSSLQKIAIMVFPAFFWAVLTDLSIIMLHMGCCKREKIFV